MRKLKFPFLWLTQLSSLYPRPWEYFGVEGIMLNAYDILKKPKIVERMKKEKVHRYLGFNGQVAIDSGGFLFMKHKELPISPIKLVELYESWKPNFAVVLDHPVFPSLPENIIRKRQQTTLENIRVMTEVKKSGNPILIPVIHGYNKTSLAWYINQLEKLGEFEIYGIGSLVPFVKGVKGAKGGLYKAVDILKIVKEYLPDKKLHIFGIGSSITMHLMFLAGADSVDSSSWRYKAAYGAIQLQGIGDRYITGKASPRYPNLSKEEIEKIKKCECPACRQYGLKGLKEKFTLRALHNAWVYQQEIRIAREKIKEGTYEEYVKTLVARNKTYQKVFGYIIEKKSIKNLETWL